jgi:alanine racemase
MTAKDLAKICNGRLTGNFIGEIDTLLFDSRKISHPSTSLFACIITDKNDGHLYIEQAYQKGVRLFLVSNKKYFKVQDAAYIQVSDTLKALQEIAKAKRALYKGNVVGITGSNGKTIIKEWAAQLLSKKYNVYRSPKSFNSQLGVSLSIWELNNEQELSIIEAGISQPKEMKLLQEMIRPRIGILTNIRTAHDEYFVSTTQKITEKLQLFKSSKTIIYCTDHKEIHKFIAQDKKKELFTWGSDKKSNIQILSRISDHRNTKISFQYQKKNASITIPFIDEASIENVMHSFALGLYLGLSIEELRIGIQELSPIAMRLELKEAMNDCILINDSYNSDLAGLNIALDYLKLQTQHTHYTVILSDIAQVHSHIAQVYEEVADLIAQKGIHTFIGIGPQLAVHQALFEKIPGLKSSFYLSTAQFIENTQHNHFHKQTILLKGARSFQFELISHFLESRIHQTILEVNLNHLAHNFYTYKKLLKPKVATMAMVKAYSYGSGAYEIAQKLTYLGVDYLAVAYADEGVTLRNQGIKLPIMVMNPDINAYHALAQYQLEPEIYSLHTLSEFIRVARETELHEYPIHLKLDTGMHRLGFQEEELLQAIELLRQTNHIKIHSVFSHLAASDDPALDHYTQTQAEIFDSFIKIIKKKIKYRFYTHLCNTSGIARHPHLHYNMVRLGIGLYGVDNSKVGKGLHYIGKLKTTIAQIKYLSRGDTVGYSRKGAVNRESRIGTVCIGYGDGIPRVLSNGNGSMLVRGKLAPIIGNVCMDMCMLDLTQIPDAQVGDEVIIFGEELPITKFAAWAGTIPYEIMTGISNRVKRVYIEE